MADNEDRTDIGPKPDPSTPLQDPIGKRPVDGAAEVDPEVTQDQDPVEAVDAVTADFEKIEDGVDQPDPSPEPDETPEETSFQQPPEAAQIVQGPTQPEADIKDGSADYLPAEAAQENQEQSNVPQEVQDLDQAQQDMEAFGKDLEDFNAGKVPGGELNQDFGDPTVGGGETDMGSALKDLGDSDYRNRDTYANFLVEHQRRIDELTERVERSRL